MENFENEISVVSDISGLRTVISSFYIGHHQLYIETSYAEVGGIFIPRRMEGYVFEDGSKNETSRRKMHEISHGIYLENIPTGNEIVEMDKKMSDIEKEVFGKELRKNEKILVITNNGKIGNFSRLPVNMMNLVPEGIDYENYDYISFLSEDELNEYNRMRISYREIVNNDLENQEGFCTLVEYNGMLECCPEFAESLHSARMVQDDVYGRGFRRLKEIEDRHGFSAVIDIITESRPKAAIHV